jgi:hypothetical protein
LSSLNKLGQIIAIVSGSGSFIVEKGKCKGRMVSDTDEKWGKTRSIVFGFATLGSTLVGHKNIITIPIVKVLSKLHVPSSVIDSSSSGSI